MPEHRFRWVRLKQRDADRECVAPIRGGTARHFRSDPPTEIGDERSPIRHVVKRPAPRRMTVPCLEQPGMTFDQDAPLEQVP